MESLIITDEKVNRCSEKSEYIKWSEFEHTLRNLFSELENGPDIEDYLSLSEIQQTILVFASKDKFKVRAKILLNNMKDDFYKAIEELEKSHPDIKRKTKIIKKFMEDTYFKEFEYRVSKNLKKLNGDLNYMIYNMILELYDTSLKDYEGLEDEKFINKISEITGLTKAEYLYIIH